MHASRSRLQQWLLAFAGQAGPQPAAAAETQGMRVEIDAIRCAMVRAMHGCCDRHRARAADQVMHAPDVRTLWLVRGDLYQALARELGEGEAARRIGGLHPLFRGHVDDSELARWERGRPRDPLLH